MDVRIGHLRLVGRADRPDDVAFRDRGALAHRRRAEVDERDGQAVAGLDRHREAVLRDGARERDAAGRRCADTLAKTAADVDSAVLAARVRVVAERESAQDRPFDGPAPCAPGGRDDERGDERREQGAPHRRAPPSLE